MSTQAERDRARARAADAYATHHEVTIRPTQWWPSKPSRLTRNEQRNALRARKRNEAGAPP